MVFIKLLLSVTDNPLDNLINTQQIQIPYLPRSKTESLNCTVSQVSITLLVRAKRTIIRGSLPLTSLNRDSLTTYDINSKYFLFSYPTN